MSYRPSSPVQLPNGHWACSDHLLQVCPICTVDYTYLNELSDDGEEPSPIAPLLSHIREKRARPTQAVGNDDNVITMGGIETTSPNMILSPWAHMDLSLRRGTGRIIAEKFVPPEVVASSTFGGSATPLDIFPPGISHKASPVVRRFIHRHDQTQFLIYTDGACLDNGGLSPQAGCAFYFRPPAEDTQDGRRHNRRRPGTMEFPPPSQGYTSFHLEKRGPFGDPSSQTSNRAELRAVIGALRFRVWQGEGFRTLVIATDSEYVVEGATNWVKGWLRNNWRTRSGPVKNKDLWEALLGEIERHHDKGLKVLFWRIPRELNMVADQKAKIAAQEEPASESWNDVSGVMV
ncbi:ribonuclease H1, putative [Talaromyces stipitatus ATCC 10500]|uniref:ribonuclease H n=1 Tax=Talaromyces stipitatus (strain ATCC 10500 / CBS 375.48 / QM 6759 / NRRL 1006) TaxID=441959 RepID=B8MPL2_TALSN|nr:ribonuclease H1, putative [Talaromyces stipitatus ATCC 10500]EED14451.1 ribonuclease H1, putative [Talaromyces stipitatus ATCC 10500]